MIAPWLPVLLAAATVAAPMERRPLERVGPNYDDPAVVRAWKADWDPDRGLLRVHDALDIPISSVENWVDIRPGNLGLMVLSARVTYLDDLRVFSYEYTARSVAGNRDDLRSLYLELRSLVGNHVEPAEWKGHGVFGKATSGWEFRNMAPRDFDGASAFEFNYRFSFQSSDGPGLVPFMVGFPDVYRVSTTEWGSESRACGLDLYGEPLGGFTLGPKPAADSQAEEVSRFAADLKKALALGWLAPDLGRRLSREATSLARELETGGGSQRLDALIALARAGEEAGTSLPEVTSLVEGLRARLFHREARASRLGAPAPAAASPSELAFRLENLTSQVIARAPDPKSHTRRWELSGAAWELINTLRYAKPPDAVREAIGNYRSLVGRMEYERTLPAEEANALREAVLLVEGAL